MRDPFRRDEGAYFDRFQSTLCQSIDELLFGFEVDDFFFILETVSGSDFNDLDGLADMFIVSLELNCMK